MIKSKNDMYLQTKTTCKARFIVLQWKEQSLLLLFFDETGGATPLLDIYLKKEQPLADTFLVPELKTVLYVRGPLKSSRIRSRRSAASDAGWLRRARTCVRSVVVAH
jgi:hypothetical protein